MSKKQSTRATREYWTNPTMTKALEIALYYGFTPAELVKVEKKDTDVGKHFLNEESDLIRPAEKAALIRTWFTDNASASPIMIATPHAEHKTGTTTEYSLDVLGTNRSIADATLIKTTYEIVRAQGYQDIILELNTIGDRESFARYTRELGNYFRKHIGEIHPDCRQAVKKNIYAALTCDHPECKPVMEHLPHSMNYLSEPSRSYFGELLELLETTNIPFNINNALIANYECAMHVVFKVFGNDGKKTEAIAYGTRWGLIAKKMGFKKDIQGMSSTILINKPEKTEKLARLKKPQCYFIQMGQGAKLHSLRVIEVLRQSKIPVYHSLTKDKLTAQLTSAENLKVPYILIMGQKECLENTVLIREMQNRSQETVRIDEVAEYLRKVIR
jgi:histidyl-tRNA synthetase